MTVVTFVLFQKLEAQFAGVFIEKLAQTCETMLLQFDAVLSLDDVEVGSKLFSLLLLAFNSSSHVARI